MDLIHIIQKTLGLKLLILIDIKVLNYKEIIITKIETYIRNHINNNNNNNNMEVFKAIIKEINMMSIYIIIKFIIYFYNHF